MLVTQVQFQFNKLPGFSRILHCDMSKWWWTYSLLIGPGSEQSKCSAFLYCPRSKEKSVSNLARAPAGTYGIFVRSRKGAPSGQTDRSGWAPWAERVGVKGAPSSRRTSVPLAGREGAEGGSHHPQPWPSAGHDLSNSLGSSVPRAGQEGSSTPFCFDLIPTSSLTGYLVLLFALVGVNLFW